MRYFKVLWNGLVNEYQIIFRDSEDEIWYLFPVRVSSGEKKVAIEIANALENNEYRGSTAKGTGNSVYDPGTHT